MLLITDKIVLIKHNRNMTQWPIYLIISNLSYKIWKLWLRSRRMMVGLISIYKKDSLKIKIEIYHRTIRIIIKNIFKFLFLGIVI